MGVGKERRLRFGHLETRQRIPCNTQSRESAHGPATGEGCCEPSYSQERGFEQGSAGHHAGLQEAGSLVTRH